MMTPAEKHQLDQVQFELNEQRQRLDALCAQMNQFREEAMALLKAMGGSIVEPISDSESVPLPEVAPVLHPAPETSAPESGPLPAPELRPGSFNAAPGTHWRSQPIVRNPRHQRRLVWSTKEKLKWQKKSKMNS